MIGARIEARFLWIGLVALGFALASHRILGENSGFIFFNAVLAVLSLLAAGVIAFGRVAAPQPSALRGPLIETTLRTITSIWISLLVFGVSVSSGIRFDWTFEGQFELSEATILLLDELHSGDGARATLYYDEGDPRIRHTRLLLEELTRNRPIELRVRSLSQYPADEDRFGIGSSNSVVLELADRWTLVPRPTEGGLYEGWSQLVHGRDLVIYASVGAGEGDLEDAGDTGFSGLRAALETEGYELRPLPLAIVNRVPPDAASVLVIAPQRPLSDGGRNALRDYLMQGGRMVVFLGDHEEPALEALLAEFGVVAQPGLVIDPTSGAIDGDTAGLNPVAFNYTDHPVTRGLDANRMTFFQRTRGFELRKTAREQHLRPLVHASGESWIDTDPPSGSSRTPPPLPPDARIDYWPLAVASEFEHEGRVSRLVAIGDANMASNRYLRALYNLDLVVNSVHWVIEREQAIALRPKTGGRRLNQFPVPLEASLQALHGVGLVVPELLLIAAGWVWLRQRSA